MMELDCLFLPQTLALMAAEIFLCRRSAQKIGSVQQVPGFQPFHFGQKDIIAL